MQLNYRQKNNGLYILSKNDIEIIATEILQEYYPENLSAPTPLNTVDLLKNHLGLIIKCKYIGTLKSGILGLIVMNNTAEIPSFDEEFRPVVLEETYGTVLISQHLTEKKALPRRRYTEAHEGAHFILHRDYYSKCATDTANRYSGPCNYIACRRVEINNELPNSDIEWMEWQADSLAASLLMPKDVFYEYAAAALKRERSDYFVEIPGRNRRRQRDAIDDVAEKFCVSRRAAQIRMIHLGLISDQ